MRLPQSLASFLSARGFFGIIVTAFASILALAQATAQQLTCSPSSLTFGTVQIGETKTETITLTNSGGTSVRVSAVKFSGPQYSLAKSLPFTLSAGGSLTLDVRFAPTAKGWVGGRSTFTSNASNSILPFQVGGTGKASTASTGQLTITPVLVNFGSVPVGTTQTQSITMSASGASVTVSSDSSSNSQFVLDGVALPLTIDAGHKLSFNVAFTPKSGGAQSGSLSFSSNASNSKTTESLSGTGTVAEYSVNLSWNSSSGVAGYNIYRGTSATGTYNKINSSLDANTAYTDSTVISGQTYYYEATSVNSSGQESSRSTPPVKATVP
jgi:hypothetical protein